MVPCTALVPAVWARARPLRAGSILGILQPSEEIDLDLDEALKSSKRGGETAEDWSFEEDLEKKKEERWVILESRESCGCF